MAEVKEYETEDSFVIKVKLDEKDTRVCDYCNKPLVVFDEKQGKLICIENCYSTDYGLMCENCKGSIEALKSYKKDEEYFEPNSREEKDKQIIQKFRSKRSGEIYEVILTEGGLTCNCKGWVYRRHCKHIDYVTENLAVKDEQNRIINFVSEITDIPTYEEAKAMDFGRDKDAVKKWLCQRMRVIEI